ncbi:MAG: ribose-phosphate pyrophosphokinase [Gammaproteobacteria bacterium]|jgi:ribose-phosphate pyrophosphokinase|nr:ribose-phosphate pyrophosphokinase [Gammaproteobacteria bacterium]
MNTILFELYASAVDTMKICKQLGYELGEIDIRQFPDKETYIKINSDIINRQVIFVASIDKPNNKFLPLLFAAGTARELGAEKVGVIVPYLPYMRQDKQFQPGEGITSKYFASIFSQYFNWMITIDPHLHRRHSMSEIYTIPTYVLHSTTPIANWIKANVSDPIIIGPDMESEQWVAEVAKGAQAPFIVLEKTRKGDREVEVSLPKIDEYKTRTPILVDDIISTGKTMIETVKHLNHLKMKPPICIGVHAVFSGEAYSDLLNSGAEKVVTCNTIKHQSNMIDISDLVVNCLIENING